MKYLESFHFKNVSILLIFRVLSKDRRKLYQHSVRCLVAMQIILDANPPYWRLVSMTMEQSEKPEQQCIQRPVLSD